MHDLKDAIAVEADTLILPDLIPVCVAALHAAESYLLAVRSAVLARVSNQRGIDSNLVDQEQFVVHGYAWSATYVTALRETMAWALRLSSAGVLGDIEKLTLQAGFGGYLAQLIGGIFMSQVEVVRPADFAISLQQMQALQDSAIATLIERGNTAAVRSRLAALYVDADSYGDPGLEDPTLVLIGQQFRRFSDTRVAPLAQQWHRHNQLIPLEIVEELAALGVFGLTIPEQYGGLGLGKVALCVVTEELSRGNLGVGSLGTRAEIAAELIRLGGTSAQKRQWLPRIASGEVMPTAVFTEPGTGSDLGALRTRAVKSGADYRLTGTKTWITHGARADLMTVLARTNPNESGYKGLSMFLAEKPRGSDETPFPATGMSGSEIHVIGYRGMKEYEIAFDNFAVNAPALLGEVEGQGFKQLMATFESARIQTAARAVGVAQNSLELGLSYACSRIQFGRPIVEFPRVAGKLAWMGVETMLARQLTYFAARQKDGDRRCDIQAGMAKLLAARVAWSNADNALQIHGGNGYAEEYAISRVLCDARILNIFEGAAEIQAGVVARGLLATGE